jgi:alanine racemase
VGALAHNCGQARALVGDGVRVMAVVKADGYGHGAVAAARAFLRGGAALLGVSTVAEGAALRADGIDAPIVVLGGHFAGEAATALEHGLAVAVWSVGALDELIAAGRRSGRVPAVHVKIDSGMTRLGLDVEQVPDFAARLRERHDVVVAGVFSHLASADAVDSAPVQAQLGRFEDAVAALRAAGVEPGMVHLANSAGVLCEPRAHHDVARPGIMLYGYPPAPHLGVRAQLRPALQLVTRVVQARRVLAGRAVGYGGTFVTKRASTIAVLPVGYADGYHRLAGNRAEVVVRGCRVPVAGRVCMDHTMIDVTDAGSVEVGDRVCLIGAQGRASVWADELAAWCETIPYEMLTALAKRVPRRYVEEFDV